MAYTKLPTIKSKPEKSLEARTISHGTLLGKRKLSNLNLTPKDPCDKVNISKIDDRVFNMKKILQNCKDENFESSKKLELIRLKYSQKISDLEEEWDLLEKKEKSLKKNMVHFNTFLRENLVKRERFEENIKHHKEQTKKYEDAINLMKDSVSSSKRIITMMRQQVEKHSIYPNFLEKVVDLRGEFKSLSSLVSRFELLYDTSIKSSQMLESKKLNLENMALEMTKKYFEFTHRIQYLMHRLGVFNEAYVRAVLRSNEGDVLLRDARMEIIRLQSVVARTFDTIHEIYISICEKQGISVEFEKGDYQNQLIVIKTAMEFLENIIRFGGKKKMNKNS